jgi:hypothetical protein
MTILNAAREAASMGHRKKSIKRSRAKTILRLPDLEQSKNAVLNSLAAASSQESYGHAIDEFIGWYCSEPRLAFNRSVVLRYRFFLEQKNLAPSTINVRLAAVRRLAQEPCSRNSKETACEESVIEPFWRCSLDAACDVPNWLDLDWKIFKSVRSTG